MVQAKVGKDIRFLKSQKGWSNADFAVDFAVGFLDTEGASDYSDDPFRFGSTQENQILRSHDRYNGLNLI